MKKLITLACVVLMGLVGLNASAEALTDGQTYIFRFPGSNYYLNMEITGRGDNRQLAPCASVIPSLITVAKEEDGTKWKFTKTTGDKKSLYFTGATSGWNVYIDGTNSNVYWSVAEETEPSSTYSVISLNRNDGNSGSYYMGTNETITEGVALYSNRAHTENVKYEVIPISDAETHNVTVNFPSYNGKTISKTVTAYSWYTVAAVVAKCGYNAFFTLNDEKYLDEIGSQTSITVNGTWDKLNYVGYFDIRRKQTDNNWAHFKCVTNETNNNVEIKTTNNTENNAFIPERLFYVTIDDSTNGDLKVNLRTIAGTKDEGLTSNYIIGSNPAAFTVTYNGNGPDGFGLNISGNDYVNDVNGTLQHWNNTNAANDLGGFMRVLPISENNYGTTYEFEGETYEFNSALLATAKANPSSENIRALFGNPFILKGNAMATLSIVDSSAWTALADDATSAEILAAYNTMAKSATGGFKIAKHTVDANNHTVTDYLSIYQGHPHRWNGANANALWVASLAENGEGFVLYNDSQEKYYKHSANTNASYVATAAEATVFTLDTYDSNIENPTFAFKDSEGNYMAFVAIGSNLANWPSGGVLADACAMNIEPVATVEIQAGKYYRIKGAANADHYLAVDVETDAMIISNNKDNTLNTVWVYDADNQKLISAVNGKVIGKCNVDDNKYTFLATNTEHVGKTEFLPGTSYGSYHIRTNVTNEVEGFGTYLTSTSATFSVGTSINAAGQATVTKPYDWVVEPVDYLPVPVAAGAPCVFTSVEALQTYHIDKNNGVRTERVAAYTLNFNGAHVSKSEEPLVDIIPANTPVLLEYLTDSNYLEVAHDNNAEAISSDLVGTLLATEVENALVYSDGSFVPTTEVPGFSGYLVGEEALPLTNPVHDTAETISFTQGSKVVSINHDGVLAANDCHPHAIHIVGMARTDYQFNHNSNELKLADGNATLDLSNLENGTYTMTIEPGFFTVDGTHISKGATAEITVSDSGVTGLEELSTINYQLSTVYDLQGRRLSAPAKGINIINGKKILKK